MFVFVIFFQRSNDGVKWVKLGQLEYSVKIYSSSEIDKISLAQRLNIQIKISTDQTELAGPDWYGFSSLKNGIFWSEIGSGF